MGVRRIRFTAAFSMPKSFRLAISGQSFVWAGPATKIAPDHRELLKAGAAPIPRVRARQRSPSYDDRGMCSPRAPPSAGRRPAPARPHRGVSCGRLPIGPQGDTAPVSLLRVWRGQTILAATPAPQRDVLHRAIGGSPNRLEGEKLNLRLLVRHYFKERLS
jgi:hypothetical protein